MKKTQYEKYEVRFFLTAFIVAISLLGDGMIYAVLPSSPEEFGIKVWQIGLLLSANRFVRLLTNELAGRITSKDLSTRPLLVAAAVSALVTYSYTLPWGFAWLLFARLCWGACFSLLRIEGYLSAIKCSSAGNRSRMFGIYQAVTRLGSGGGAIAGGFLSDLIGFRLTFILFGTVTLCSLLPAKNSRNLTYPSAAENSAKGKMDGNEKKILLKLGMAVFVIAMSDQIYSDLTGRIVVDHILPGFPAAIGAASLAGLLLGTRHLITFSAPLVGWVCDRTGRKNALFFFLSAEIMTAVCFSLVRVWFLLLAAVIVHYLISCAAGIIIYSYAGDRAPEKHQAVFMSRFTTFGDLGTALGPVTGFLIYAGPGLMWVGLFIVPLILSVLFILRKV